MPLLAPDAPLDEGAPDARFPKQPTADGQAPSALDVAAAAERTSNIVGQTVERFKNPRPDAPIQSGFNPIDHIPAGYLHDYGHRFLDAENPEQVQWIKSRIDSERQDQQVLGRAGWGGTAASFAAGQTDPLTLASMALFPAAAATRAGNAARWALTNAAISAAQETAAQSLSETRTTGESLLNIGGGAVLGGLLGSVARRVPKGTLNRMGADIGAELREPGSTTALGPEQRSIADPQNLAEKATTPKAEAMESPGFDAAYKEFDAKPVQLEPEAAKPAASNEPDFHPLPGEPAYVNPNEGSTAGAAAVSSDIEDLTTGRGAQTLTGTIGKVTPGGRLMTQPSLAARKLTLELANITGTMEQNYKGVANPNPIERILWGYDGLHSEGMSDRREQFKGYLQRIQQEGGDPLSRREFMDQITYAMRRGDQSAIPEVAKAASATRAKIFQPLYDRAVKAGLVAPEANLHAESYMMRQYDTVKIRKNMSGWIDTLRQGFMEQGLDNAEALDVAHKATRNVIGSERGTMDWHAMDNVVPTSGRMKERTLTLPDHSLEPYLNNDIDHLSHSYLRSMAPEVEMTERFGSRDLKDQLGDVTDEYTRMMERARAVGDDAAIEKLGKQRDGAISDLGAIRDRLYGTYGAPKDPGAFLVRAARLARQVNAGSMLGAATLSHLPDFANVMLRYGAPNTFSAMGKLATSLDAMKLGYSEAKRMGAALDMTMNMTASLLGDYGSHSQFAEQRIANKLTRSFTIATGETPLITLTQAMTSVMAQDDLIRAAQRIAGGNALSANRAAKLASAGIDEAMLGRIGDQHAKFGQEINGLKFGMTEQWKDQGAAQAFESAVIREAHGVTLRPGVADTPLFMSGEIGKTMLQFKSFAFAANRVVGTPLAQGIAHGDVRAAAALLALTSMGTLSYVLKQKAAGQPLETNNPGRLAGEVLDKSNLLGWTGEVIFPSMWLAGFKNLSRWSDRDPVQSILGPTAGTVADAFERQLPGRIGNPELPFRRSDAHFVRRMMPGQNLWYARRGVNALEDMVGDAFDLPGKSNEQRELVAMNQ